MGIGAIILGLIPTIVGAVKSVEQLLPNSSGIEKRKAAIVVTNQFIGILHAVDGLIGDKLSDMDEELIGEWIDLVVRTLNRVGEFTHKDVA